ncbi:Putative uncharacterized protein [Thermobacillus xylanilyticus]|uniref:Winged helix-turn-helix domain-containing protein n=1 Tax=Thermobacillus xylanilyticus TaxID=76633 RepID=A0ABM8V7J1_THEXY|nr:crosslink repair DNA glycosylase YcaQ family protein [Thermobacillus xylanilyticus]CAG5091742.1 Putative uncharacterized protein [Thermobacillus xylanilyticus]
MERVITRRQAGQFLLVRHGLAGEWRYEGKEGAMAWLRMVRCLQFDPLNVVGYNPHLVLQSRIRGYRPEMLDELLYQDRLLFDGWDKNMSILLTEDWPCFARRRQTARARLLQNPKIAELAPLVIRRLEERGPLSSADLEFHEKIDWPWAPARLSRAVLESLFFAGEVIIHHKEGARKIYDLSRRHLPADVLDADDPNPTEDEHHDWHVLRRIGAIGMLWNKSGDAWLGIAGMKSGQRTASFERLHQSGRICKVIVEGLEKHPLYVKAEDVPLLDEVIRSGTGGPDRASMLAPLDNLLWDRRLILELFGFDYRWEVYKPAAERRYGYYVLPVVYGDRFIGRIEPVLDRSRRRLIIRGWWPETGVEPADDLRNSLADCIRRFTAFTGADLAQLDETAATAADMRKWLQI